MAGPDMHAVGDSQAGHRATSCGTTDRRAGGNPRPFVDQADALVAALGGDVRVHLYAAEEQLLEGLVECVQVGWVQPDVRRCWCSSWFERQALTIVLAMHV